jgi:hypothetical protein
MTSIRIVVLSFAAVLAIGLFASSASAEAPEYGRCVKTAGGKFKNSTCTVASVPGEEKYEWFPGAVKNKFRTKLKVSTFVTFETTAGTKLVCHEATGEGEITGAKSTTGSYVFSGCETSKLQCQSEGGEPGTLIGNTLNGLLGIEVEAANPANNSIAEDLFPAEAGGLFVEFTCSGLSVVARGSVLNPTTENTMTESTTLKWSAAKGKQKPEKFVGGPTAVCEVSLNGGAFQQCGGTLTMVLTLEEKLEINTVV